MSESSSEYAATSRELFKIAGVPMQDEAGVGMSFTMKRALGKGLEAFVTEQFPSYAELIADHRILDSKLSSAV